MIIKQILRRQVSFGGAEHSGWLPAGAATPTRLRWNSPSWISELKNTMTTKVISLSGRISLGDILGIHGTKRLTKLLRLRIVTFRLREGG